ncbi:hypothetical protein SAMN03159475_0089 [Pseudomonas sp. NFPP33]|nr:hypothetical protein [Pseudomonas sp. NFPP33]AGH89235.1 hypothetical protein [uncultured bacterium]SDA85213.1 hypothetical protein SAMN03159475_0089 [Pseudomonas sp. NFPP33]
MQDKELKQAMDTLSANLAEANVSLRVLALMKLAEEFYTKEERQEFYERRRVLMDEAEEVRQALTIPARPEDSRSWEEFEKQEPAEKVAEVRQQIQDRHDNAREASRKVSEYEKQHPVLTALLKHRHKAAKEAS